MKKLMESLKDVLSLVEDNILVRNIDGDNDRQHFLRQGIHLTQILKNAQQAINEAERKED